MLLVFGGDEELIVNGYTDVGFMTDQDDFKSQSDYFFILNGGAVCFQAKHCGGFYYGGRICRSFRSLEGGGLDQAVP